MSDYIATLEAQNEELKQKLAEKQDHMPKWEEHDQTKYPDRAAFVYIIHNLVFGFVSKTDYGWYAKTQKGVVDGDGGQADALQIAKLKKHVEQEYLDMFLLVVRVD